jgi:hypothetical protein
MTEDEWLTWNGISDPMMEFLRGKPGLGRKRRLLAVACCHRVMKWMPAECVPAVELAERLAEGPVDEEERWAAFNAAGESCDEQQDFPHSWAGYCAFRAVETPSDYEQPTSWKEDAAAWVAQTAAEPASWINGKYDSEIIAAERREIAGLIQDIFGNPFRPVTIQEAWLTPEVVGQAKAIYEDQQFHLLPILADELEKAGCQDTAILGHCRQGKTHVRGCWVVDLVLRKS